MIATTDPNVPTKLRAVFGTVQPQEGNFWPVRFGPGVTDVMHLRGCQFRFPADHGPRNIWTGQQVWLHYIVERNSGLWYAYPIIGVTAVTSATPRSFEV